MKTQRKHEEKPWQPEIERQPEFNPFVNPLDRTGQLENPPPLEDSEPEENASVDDDRVAGETTRTTAPVASAKRTEAAVRHAMIAQAAYFLSERRSFCAGRELDDWLAAETEVDRILAAKQAAGQG
ncbi:MAG: DUF2934 domain-containing protein [Steroidobacteraceae bacterium]|jgi:DUF2934 family protein